MRAIDVAWGVADYDHASRLNREAEASRILGDRQPGEIAPTRRLVPERGDLKPGGLETDRRELQRNGVTIVSGEQAESRRGTGAQARNPFVNARHDPHLRPVSLKLAAEPFEIAVAKALMMARIIVEAVQRGGLGKDQWVQVARDDDAVPAEVDAEKLRRGCLHRPHTGAAAEHQRTVDVEEHERLRKRHAASYSTRETPSYGLAASVRFSC